MSSGSEIFFLFIFCLLFPGLIGGRIHRGVLGYNEAKEKYEKSKSKNGKD